LFNVGANSLKNEFTGLPIFLILSKEDCGSADKTLVKKIIEIKKRINKNRMKIFFRISMIIPPAIVLSDKILKALVKYIFFFGWFSLLITCHRFEVKEIQINNDYPLRCGYYTSYLFDNEVQEEHYPDLGVLLSQAKLLNLSNTEKIELEKSAIQCYEICELQKQKIRLKEEALRMYIKKNKIKNPLKYLSEQINDIQKDKKKWLEGHRKRYEKAIHKLPIYTLPTILRIEKNFNSF